MPTRSSAWRTRWVALAAASVAAGCARPGAAPGPPRAEGVPEVRIGLASGAASVIVGGQGRVTGFAGGAAQVRLGAGETVTLRPDGRAVAAGANGRHSALTFASLDGGRYVEVNGRPYRGAVEVTAANGGVTVVNVVPLEDYLRGVVGAELGPRTAAERSALEAQAIVSRTYALKNLGRFRAEGYDLQAGVADQVYGGAALERPEVDAAVRATTGRVLTWRDQLIVPFFHSTCGFATAAPEVAFRSVRGLDYLRPVSDERPGGGYYCDISPRFRWTVEWDGATLRDILRRTVPGVLGVPADEVTAIRDVYVRRTGAGGRALEIRVRVDGGEIPVFGPDIRQVFRTPEDQVLGSQAIQLTAERRDEQVIRLTAAGAGWGHGVGMCQWGAIGRARAGQSAETILTTYFPGTTIARWY